MPIGRRLPDFDYATPGWYFVTCVTEGRRQLLGELEKDGVVLSRIGRVVADEWESTLRARFWISCTASVVMPDHFHALIGWNDVPTNRCGTLGGLMAHFKGNSIRRLRRERLVAPWETIWHRRYWDQVIRGRRQLEATARYIENNPAQAWLRRSQRPVPR